MIECKHHGEFITRFFNIDKIRNSKKSVVENVSRDRCEYCKKWMDDIK